MAPTPAFDPEESAMTPTITVGIVGDYDETYTTHLATDAALSHAAAQLGIRVERRWLAPVALERDPTPLADVDAVLCAPGSPYSSLDGALEAIRFARTSRLPALGTCGGCQHMLLEFARNVLGVHDAQHAECAPDADEIVISALACSLVGRTGKVDLLPPLSELYGAAQTQEQYFCGFGLHPAYESDLERGGFRIVGRDAQDRTPRAFVLDANPFYVAALFVPQVSSTPGAPHVLVRRLVEAAAERRRAAPAAATTA
jgi:CTP synthase (UTP-ammonia lyase)